MPALVAAAVADIAAHTQAHMLALVAAAADIAARTQARTPALVAAAVDIAARTRDRTPALAVADIAARTRAHMPALAAADIAAGTRAAFVLAVDTKAGRSPADNWMAPRTAPAALAAPSRATRHPSRTLPRALAVAAPARAALPSQSCPSTPVRSPKPAWSVPRRAPRRRHVPIPSRLLARRSTPRSSRRRSRSPRCSRSSG